MSSTNISYLPLWARYQELFGDSGMTDAEVGKLVRSMMDYYFQNIPPSGLPDSIRYCWVWIKSDLEYAKRQYLTSVNNGKKGGRPRKPKETQQNPEKPITITESITNTITESITDRYTRSAPSRPVGQEGVCVEKQAFGEFGWVKLKPEQYRKLVAQWGPEEVERCITYVDEAAQSTNNKNRWKDWYLILRRCHRDQWHTEEKKSPIPQGASGILGEAELEAIQRVLQE